MAKYSKVVALFATIGWLAFTFSAYSGFSFWYAGFAFFLWLALGSLNYNQKSSLWLLRNKWVTFLKFYWLLLIFSILTDLVVFQWMLDVWSYPHYNSFDDWGRLYLIIYPFGGLAILEFVFFLNSIFKERLTFMQKRRNKFHRFIDKFDNILLAVVFLAPATFFLNVWSPSALASFIISGLLIWGVVASIKLAYHIRHGVHYVATLVAAFAMSVFLHEIPNVAVFEWKYNEAPFLNQHILGVPLYIIFGWYILVLIVLRFWIYFVQKKEQN
ncbi:MAG: hypothetical protein WD898_02775 [Candidatus Paceibacterota bacterium]